MMDSQELEERLEAATALADEDPDHLVDYCEACIEESKKATAEIRQLWDECWKAYQNKMDYSEKEDWQSKVVLNKPFVAVKQAVAVIRRAMMTSDFFSTDGVGWEDKGIAEVVKRTLSFWLDPQRADFPVKFTDATEMGFVTGQSMEIVPTWQDEAGGLKINLIEPWKIFRDPDANPRDPWSGLYWIHQEWVDKWVLEEGERNGIFQNTENLKEDSDNRADAEQVQRRRDQYWSRSKYRKSVLVSEFWGTLLDKQGKLLLPSTTYTVAGGELIRRPRDIPFAKMRWPGVSYSPLSHLLRFEGRGIIEGVLTLWWMINNMWSLHIDNMNWVINKVREIDSSLLKYPGDLDIYPGKVFEKKPGTGGVPAITEIGVSSQTTDVLANLQYMNQEYDNATFVNQFVAGLPGTRSNITKGEVEIKTQQSLGVFDSIGADIESGGVKALWSVLETIALNWTKNSKPNIMEVLSGFPEAVVFSEMPIELRREFLRNLPDVKLTGISAKLKEAEMLQALFAMMSKAENPKWGIYVKPYKLFKRIIDIIGFKDADFVLTEEEAAFTEEYVLSMGGLPGPPAAGPKAPFPAPNIPDVEAPAKRPAEIKLPESDRPAPQPRIIIERGGAGGY